MSEKSETKIAKQPAQAQDLMPPDVDGTAILSDHMYKFVYGPNPRMMEAVQQLNNQAAGMANNAAILAGIDRASSNVRDCMQNRALRGAELGQVKVVELTSQLDLGAISAAIAGNIAKGGNAALVNVLKMAGATPLVERIRLGAIQMRQSEETDAEKTFEQAYKADIAKESKELPEVVQLRKAAQKMYEELKLRRTLPDVFDNNLTLIDTVIKDGAMSKEELTKSRKSGVENGLTQTLIEYLLKNFDQMKRGDNSIDRSDVVAYQKKVMLKGMPR
ncbi:MAG: hypothetical protein IT342_09090 [Candidatus Melainabacteria bacterium]|nr:hypothetical protein [Candidatus Melainabacteria bacterium]